MICQKQHRQNELAGQVDVPTRVKFCATGGSWTCVGTTDVSIPVKNNTENEPAGQVDIPTRVKIRVTGDSGHV